MGFSGLKKPLRRNSTESEFYCDWSGGMGVRRGRFPSMNEPQTSSCRCDAGASHWPLSEGSSRGKPFFPLTVTFYLNFERIEAMTETYVGAIDKGLEGVIACTTGISYIIDANLIYRGYTIEDLAENSSFEEVIFLLWNGYLPKSDELKTFQKALRQGAILEEGPGEATSVPPL